MAARILCLVPALEHAHYSRRAAMLQRAGFTVEAIGFDREGRPGGGLPCPTTSLGFLPRAKYARRLFLLARALPRLRRAMRRADLLYAFGPDLAGLALLAAARDRGPPLVPVVLESPDIRPRQTGAGPASRFLRRVERLLTARCRLLVLTAPDYEIYYREWLRVETPSLLVENKVAPEAAAAFDPSSSAPPPGTPFRDRPLRLGWFGLLRDDWSLRLLEALDRDFPGRFEFTVAGAPAPVLPDFGRRTSRLAGLDFRGPYRQHEAPALFAGVDLALACYPPAPPHWRWSRSNRFYLACLSRTPPVTRAGTADAAEAEREGLGPLLRDGCPRRAAAALDRITDDDLNGWHRNLGRLPRARYVTTPEDDARVASALGTAIAHPETPPPERSP